MKSDKFLTVFAVFDDETQRKLKDIQNNILSLGEKGTQTMDIPFHITLGSFPVEDERSLKSRIKEMYIQNRQFDISLNKINHFDNKVLFIEPKKSKELKKLHDLFNMNYEGGFPYHAHTTIFCSDKSQVEKAKKRLREIFKPIKAKVTEIWLGEFFPTRMLAREELNKIKDDPELYSYVMGVGKNIKELKSKGFKIKKYGNDYAVTFPKSNSCIWENFIIENLEVGYWNEYIGNNCVTFLFRLSSGIRRFEVHDFDDAEVLALCEKLAERKFSSIKNMLEENKFYKKILNP